MHSTDPCSPLQAFTDYVTSVVNPDRVTDGLPPLSVEQTVKAFELSLELDRQALLQMEGLVPA